MIDLKPDELLIYLDFFQTLDEALIEGGKLSNIKFPGRITPAKVLLEIGIGSKNPDKYKRQYTNAKSGSTWLSNELMGKLNSALFAKQYNPPCALRLENAWKIYIQVREHLKYGRNKHWGAGSISSKEIQKRFDLLKNEFGPTSITYDFKSFSSFIDKSVRNKASRGNHGLAIDNARVIVEYMLTEQNRSFSGLGDGVFELYFTEATRAGAWVSQTVGQWSTFYYFMKKTGLFVDKGHCNAEVVYQEHQMHHQRRFRLLGKPWMPGSAAIALNIGLLARQSPETPIDPLLYLNAADEFLEYGLGSNDKPPDLNGLSIGDLFDRFEKERDLNIERYGEYPTAWAEILDFAYLTLITTLHTNDKKINEAKTTLERSWANFGRKNSDNTQAKRGLYLLDGRLDLIQGLKRSNNLEEARKINLEMGAFHKVREIDRLFHEKKLTPEE